MKNVSKVSKVSRFFVESGMCMDGGNGRSDAFDTCDTYFDCVGSFSFL